MVNKNDNLKNKLLIKRIMIVLIVILSIYLVARTGINCFYSHDSNATVSSDSMFSDDLEEITVSSFNFYVPSNLKLDVYSSAFVLRDYDNTYIIRVDVEDGDFQHILSNYSRVKFPGQAYSGKPKIKKYGDKKYVVVDTAKWFGKTLVAVTDAGYDKIISIAIINRKNTYDYKLLKKFSEIIDSIDIIDE